MTGLVAGKVALVTGAGSGIGRASAAAFAREGARVGVCDIDAAGATETVRLIEADGGEAFVMTADVSRAADVEAAVAAVVERWGRLDCAHNNAGISGLGGLTGSYPEDDWDRVMEVNLRGVWLCLKAELTQMVAQGGGAIVNQSAVAGLVANPGLPAYTVSKHGVLGLTRNAAVEYARRGIRVNAICPGPVLTPMMTANMSDEAIAQLAQTQPGGRIARPEEIAEVAVWLCSDRASFVSGAALPVDNAALQIGIVPFSEMSG
jgi:NAD(P)-dependent dehydrogenase (short-subunit alcohol dehydrogenase family)